MVEEWDSLEQMNADFAQQVKEKEQTFTERETHVSEIELKAAEVTNRLQAWSHRLADHNTTVSIERNKVHRSSKSLRSKGQALSSEKTRLLHIRTVLDDKRLKMEAKDRKIRNLAKAFISVTEE